MQNYRGMMNMMMCMSMDMRMVSYANNEARLSSCRIG